MAKTSVSVVLVVLAVALFLNGYNAAESVERGNFEPEKDDAGDFKHMYLKFFTCWKLYKLCYFVDYKYCREFFDKCKDLETTAAKSANPHAQIQTP